MSEDKTISTILENKIIAIVRGIAGDRILNTAKALYAGGIRAIEVTFNQSSSTCVEDTSNAIEALCSEFGECMCVGAGTVISQEQLYAANKAGAKYIISPHLDLEIVRETKKLGLVSMPGCFTPSEIVAAHAAGADIIKLFPAGVLGIPYIKAIRAPISHVPLAAVGGVDENNIKDYMGAGISCFGIGSNIVKESLIKDGQYDEITELAKKFVSQVK